MSATARPLPRPDADTRPFWDACRRHELRVQQCRACESFRFYPGPICPSCGSTANLWQRVSGRGEVYSYVVVRRAAHPAFAGDVPYVVALVELEGTGGIRLPARIVDCPLDQVAIGMALDVGFETATNEITLPVFRPVDVRLADTAFRLNLGRNP